MASSAGPRGEIGDTLPSLFPILNTLPPAALTALTDKLIERRMSDGDNQAVPITERFFFPKGGRPQMDICVFGRETAIAVQRSDQIQDGGFIKTGLLEQIAAQFPHHLAIDHRHVQ